MIIKSMSRKSNPAQLIKYATRYALKENEKVGQQEFAPVLIRHNLRGKTVEAYITEFLENESYRVYRRKNNVILFHTVISFAPESTKHISRGLLKDIAQKFIAIRAPDCLHLAVAHLEREHKHIHILTSGVQVNGRSSRVSKPAFARILNELEQYQQEKYPQLFHSVNTHEKIKTTDKTQLLNHLQKSRNSTKLSIYTSLKIAYQSAHSQDEFIKNLSAIGHQTYFRNGRLQGIQVDGKKFRFISLGFSTKNMDHLWQQPSRSTNNLNEINSSMAELESIRRKSKERDKPERGMGNLHTHFETTMSFDR